MRHQWDINATQCDMNYDQMDTSCKKPAIEANPPRGKGSEAATNRHAMARSLTTRRFQKNFCF